MCMATQFSGVDLSAGQSRASVANPLYSPINPRGCAHPVGTEVWACKRAVQRSEERCVRATEITY